MVMAIRGDAALWGTLYRVAQKERNTYTIANFKDIRDQIKLVRALISIRFFFQQNDTKINDFDEGVMISEPIFWGNVIFKICSFCVKSHIWSRENFFK